MLVSLTGMQKEGVKDIVRRLFDMGDVNKKVEEVGHVITKIFYQRIKRVIRSLISLLSLLYISDWSNATNASH